MGRPSPMAPSLLTTRDLGRRVADRWLWRGLELSLTPGAAVAVTGPSGSGKTLLLRVLAGLDAPDEGEVRLEERSIDAWPMPSYRARVAYIPQRPVALTTTVGDDLRRAFALRVHRGRTFPHAEALGLLASVGRGEAFLRLATDSLSGGESQVLALVRALLLQPQVLLLDEPTASLDETTAREVESLVSDWLHAEDRRAVVWTSHQAEQLRRVATSRVHLDGDRP